MVYNPAQTQTSERQMTIRSVPPDTMYENTTMATVASLSRSWRVLIQFY